jgi:hypothetical protein
MVLVSEADMSKSEKMALYSIGLLLTQRVVPCSHHAGWILSETWIVIMVVITTVCSLAFLIRHLAF